VIARAVASTFVADALVLVTYYPVLLQTQNLVHATEGLRHACRVDKHGGGSGFRQSLLVGPFRTSVAGHTVDFGPPEGASGPGYAEGNPPTKVSYSEWRYVSEGSAKMAVTSVTSRERPSQAAAFRRRP
jgi:hypothetical protein